MINEITFINHASVKFNLKNKTILTDPWYEGAVFHNGWKLIYENKKEEILNHINNLDYIYISHEHPDHFSVNFFLDKDYQKILLKNKTKILFQKTLDKRVFSFLKKNDYDVIEIDEHKPYKIDKNLEINIIKFGYIDSALIIKTDEIKILNLNDCPLNEGKEIKTFKKKFGKFDILLSQFSYAAWKGGKENHTYRKEAARKKIDSLKKVSNLLECKHIIPFASHIYFANELNFYMNDEINTPSKVYNLLSSNNIPIIFKPGETQNLNSLKQDSSSLDFWDIEYKKIKDFENLKYKTTINIEELNKNFFQYKKKIFEINSFFIIKLLSLIKFFNFFQNINIFLVDHKKNYKFSIFSGLQNSDKYYYDIKLHSESLNFIFKHNFGFDTLTVNGCFESDKNGFTKTVKNFAIGTLNSLGIKVDLKIIFNIKLILFFLNLLANVKKKII